MLAHQLEHARHASGLASRGGQRGAVAGLARKQARNRHFSAMRRVECLEHQRHGVGTGLDAEPLCRFAGAGSLVAKRFQEPQHAVGACGNAEQHRTDDAIAQFLREVVENLVARRLDILEQLLHQLVVVIGQRLQHGEARFFLAVEVFTLELDDLRRRVLLVDIGALEREVDEPGNDVAVPDRNLAEQQRRA